MKAVQSCGTAAQVVQQYDLQRTCFSFWWKEFDWYPRFGGFRKNSIYDFFRHILRFLLLFDDDNRRGWHSRHDFRSAPASLKYTNWGDIGPIEILMTQMLWFKWWSLFRIRKDLALLIVPPKGVYPPFWPLLAVCCRYAVYCKIFVCLLCILSCSETCLHSVLSTANASSRCRKDCDDRDPNRII